jgi:D-alanyl-lipoteichoic acid acyltransferase DltB (MBOAT superfamily)
MADNLAPLVERAFGSQEPVTGVSAWLAIYAFAFQILGDFAGYSFIAMGLASLLGIQLTTNFLFPYFVTNPRDFWRNWHITLSSWLRDYLYVPLGGNRGSNYFIARNLMITMLLGGLWHGAAWVFVLWGLYQGVLLAAHRASDALGITGGEARRYPFVQGIKVILMFQLICFGWLIFRANSVEQVLELFQAMFGSMALPTLEEWRVLTQLGFFSGIVLLVQWMQSRSGDVTSMGGIPGSARVPLVIVMFYALLAWGNFGGGEFIYFQF